MPEYISREAAISRIRDEGVLGGDYDAYEREEDVVDTLNSIPAADVAEVRHGHWYLDNGCAFCSECKNSFTPRIRSQALFCPRCGAKMDLPEPPEEEA